MLLLLLPLNAAPLGLGDINLRSALNQPLDAEIELSSLGQTNVEDITVNLASREAFARAGIDRPPFLSGVTFEIAQGADGVASVRLSSSQPITEPFMDFLLEVNWPNGRLLREYTVLLDPPLLLDEAPAPVAAPSAGIPTQTASPAPRPLTQASAPARETGSPSGPAIQQGADGAWNYGPVERDATLWSIAEELRALDPSVTVEQIMMALLRNNPDAFYNENVNELKAGYVLRIDDPATISAMSRAAAVAETRRQSEQWADAKRSAADLAGSRPQGAEGAMAGAGSADAATDGPRLRLSAPEAIDSDRRDAGAAEVGESGGETVQRMREDLAAALEVSESTQQENADLRQRLAALEEQISSMQRLLTLQEDTLAAMQSARPDTAQITPEAQAPAGVMATLQAAQRNLLGMLRDPMVLGLAAVTLLLLGTLGWLIGRRRRMANATLEEYTAQPVSEPRVPNMSGNARASTAGVSVASASNDLLASEDFEDTIASAVEDSGADLMQADEDEIDILAEADVYLAYRRFDKAEELLKDAIQEDPTRRDLVLKLLEVHAATGDSDAFVQQAESLKNILDGSDAPLWDKVVAMGKRVAPGHLLFAAAAAHAAGQPAQSIGEVDLSDDADKLELDAFDREIQDMGLQIGGDTDAAGDAQESIGQGFFETEEQSDQGLEQVSFSETGSELDLSLDTTPGEGEAYSTWQDDASAGLDMSIDQGADAVSGVPGEADEAAEQPHHTGTAFASNSGDQDGASDDGDDPAQAFESTDTGLVGDIEWLSAVGEDLGTFESDSEDDGEFSGLISGGDEVGTKLDLAKAYIDMGDQESARSILSEVNVEGSEDQQREADDLMRQIG